MTRIYENRGYALRANISLVVMVVVIVYGFFELYRIVAGGTTDQFAPLFAVLFIGGGIYGGYTVWTEGRDQVVSLDADFESRRAVVAIWRPFRNLVFDTGFDQLSGWRHWVKVAKRNMRTHYVVVRVPGYPQPAYMELTKGVMPEGFRRLAPGVVEDFEENTGRRGAAEPSA